VAAEIEGDRRTALAALAEASGRDILVFSGPLFEPRVGEAIDLLHDHDAPSGEAYLFLTTYGGDPDSAFRLIKAMRGRYGTVTVAIGGPCKSAGTLIALGASDLAMGPCGELGPLDIQMAKPDEIVPNSSGLDLFQAIGFVTETAFETFEEYMLRIVSGGGGQISTRTAAEIGWQYATSLFHPIMAQIDPARLGEAQRAIRIAIEYGERMAGDNVKPGALQKLTYDYPSHGFVIDIEEAGRLFEVVREFGAAERAVGTELKGLLRYPAQSPTFLFQPTLKSAAKSEPNDGERRDEGDRRGNLSKRAKKGGGDG